MHKFFFEASSLPSFFFFFFFNDTATTEIYTLSLHDALPAAPALRDARRAPSGADGLPDRAARAADLPRRDPAGGRASDHPVHLEGEWARGVRRPRAGLVPHLRGRRPARLWVHGGRGNPGGAAGGCRLSRGGSGSHGPRRLHADGGARFGGGGLHGPDRTG